MGSSKHEKDIVVNDKPYEGNEIGLKGIFVFGGGLLALIVVTFGLMWAFESILADNFRIAKKTTNPMMDGAKNRLPPEPRLQAAPGFGVESEHGWVNLELREPQAEYRELRKQWNDVWKNGQTDATTGTVVTIPIEKAKELFLAANVKARSGEEAAKRFSEKRMFISDSSSGRVASEKQR